MIYGDDLALVHHLGFSEFARSAAPGIISILRAHGIERGLVVDAGCGSGVVSRALTDAGYEVFGFDASEAMVRLARETAPRARFVVGSVSDVELPPCNAVLAIGEVVMYADSPHAFFERVRAALHDDGVLLFDAGRRGAYPPKDSAQYAGAGWEVYVEKWLDGDLLHRRIVTYREGRRSEELHTQRLHAREELVSMLRAAGFSVRVRRSYGTRRLPPTHDVYVAACGARRHPRSSRS